METTEDMEFNAKTAAISINMEPVPKGTLLTLSGWGRVTQPGDIPNDLQVIQLESITVSECQDMYGPYDKVFENELCTLSPVGRGACKGDSGGPLVLGGSLVGLVSWGEPCARGKPDVFTHVRYFKDWVNKHTL